MSVNFRRFGWAGSVISVGSVWFGSVLAFTDNRILTKPVYMHYAKNEKATQPMHLCGSISAFCYSQSFNEGLDGVY